MAAITLEFAQARLTLWLEAEAALATGQNYSIETGGSKRSLSRVDAGEVRKMVDYWRREVERLTSGSNSPRVRLIVPRD